MNDLENALVRNAELKSYLSQLSELVGSEVMEGQLSSPEEAQQLKEAASQLRNHPKRIIRIAPGDLTKDRFFSFVDKLSKANSAPVSIWLNATSSCGTFFLSGIDGFNFSFQFAVIPEGVVVLLTKDGGDKLLFDFSPDEVELEFQGKTWGDVEY